MPSSASGAAATQRMPERHQDLALQVRLLQRWSIILVREDRRPRTAIGMMHVVFGCIVAQEQNDQQALRSIMRSVHHSARQRFDRRSVSARPQAQHCLPAVSALYAGMFA